LSDELKMFTQAKGILQILLRPEKKSKTSLISLCNWFSSYEFDLKIDISLATRILPTQAQK